MIQSRIIIKKTKVSYKDLSQEKVVGLAYNDGDGPKIDIHNDQSDRELFLTMYHELSHHLLPDLREKQIVKIEKTVGVTLWKVVCRLKRKWEREWEKEHTNLDK